MPKSKHSPNWGGARAGAGRKSPLSLYERAKRRVDGSKLLSPFEDFIFSDWSNNDEHLEWVITTPVIEILDWIAHCKN